MSAKASLSTKERSQRPRISGRIILSNAFRSSCITLVLSLVYWLLRALILRSGLYIPNILFNTKLITFLVMILRLPGEILFEPLRSTLSLIVYELVLFLVGFLFAFIFWIFGSWILFIRRRARQLAGKVSESSLNVYLGHRPERFLNKPEAVLVTLLLLWLINVVFGPIAVHYLYALKPMLGVPLRVITEVSVSQPYKAKVKETFYRLPVILMLLESIEQQNEIQGSAECVWNNMAKREGGYCLNSKKGHTWKYQDGNRPAIIKSNFNTLVQEAGGGWWREEAGGYLACFKKKIPIEARFEGLAVKFPPAILLAKDVNNSCLFLKYLTGVLIQNLTIASNKENVDLDWLDKFAWPGRDDYSQNRPKPFLLTKQEYFLPELVKELAKYNKCFSEQKGDRLVLRDLKPEEIGPRVMELFEAMWAAPCRPRPDPTVQLFPEGSAEFVAEYLDDRNEDLIQYAIEVLGELGADAGQKDLHHMLATRQTKKGMPLSENTLEMAAWLLMREGDPAGMAFLEKEGKIKDEYSFIGRLNKKAVPLLTYAAANLQNIMINKY